MKILNVKFNGMYMFKDAEFKLYTERTSVNKYRKNISKFEKCKIHPKDINVIIGGNASGKTTFSKALLLTERLISGFQLGPEELKVLKDEFSIEIKYIVNKDESSDYVFCYEINGTNEIAEEKLSYGIFKKKNTINHKIIKENTKIKLFDNLEEIKSSKFRFDYSEGLQSEIMIPKEKDKNYEEIRKAKNIGYRFSHTEFGDNLYGKPKNRMREESLNKFLKTIDKSISDVKYTKSDKADFYITFKEGKDLLVDHTNLIASGKRLSYGTVEAIIFFFKIYDILQGVYNTVYIDEELSHLQSELEKVLLLCLIENLPSHTQLFFSTHNLELLSINLPLSCYTILSEDEEGNTMVTHPEEYLSNKNDRNNLSNHLISNYFETEKTYDEIYDIFEKLI